MNMTKLAFAIGSTVGARRLMRSVQAVNMNDVLGSIGLERRRSALDKVLPALGYVGLGTVIGAGAALLMAPSSGRELRAKVSHQLDEAKSRVDQRIRSVEGAAEEMAARRNNGG